MRKTLGPGSLWYASERIPFHCLWRLSSLTQHPREGSATLIALCKCKLWKPWAKGSSAAAWSVIRHLYPCNQKCSPAFWLWCPEVFLSPAWDKIRAILFLTGQLRETAALRLMKARCFPPPLWSDRRPGTCTTYTAEKQCEESSWYQTRLNSHSHVLVRERTDFITRSKWPATSVSAAGPGKMQNITLNRACLLSHQQNSQLYVLPYWNIGAQKRAESVGLSSIEAERALNLEKSYFDL